MERNRFYPKSFIPVLVIFLVLLVLGIIASFMFGARSLTMQEVIDGLMKHQGEIYETSVVQKRVIRTIYALCCGAALGIAGVLMQSVTRNPIADPSILGVNTGAALFVVCGMAFFQINTASQYIWFALAGALLTAIFVFGIGSLGRGGATPLKLVLAGAATSAAFSSLVTAVMIPRSYVMDQFRFWQVGSVGAGTWDSLALLLPFLLSGVLIAVITAPALNALALGEEMATGLGVKTSLLRLVAAFAGVILCGATTAVAGPIGFVGLLATHVIRMLLGPDLRYLIPMSALSGAVILTVSDVLGRLIGRPGELEVGVLTAFLGAPLLIILTMKAKVRSL
ncbi:iron ABC transporter permease [Brevibacillus thermoruber]|jgi:iron complex transport system permease protein|uniref:Iron ABC transporter permease n=1 Tax=Brevibacillus thermoruber TaxID=33942 RepID=A0A9X3TU05_9BACL|nr:iron ABC transporter permease [Brevibacillus thermoruber]MDA5110894.1 iron ABC transporter permease [Brevibacillus thermoruber]